MSGGSKRKIDSVSVTYIIIKRMSIILFIMYFLFRYKLTTNIGEKSSKTLVNNTIWYINLYTQHRRPIYDFEFLYKYIFVIIYRILILCPNSKAYL